MHVLWTQFTLSMGITMPECTCWLNCLCSTTWIVKQKQKWCSVPLEEAESGRGSSVAIDKYLTKNTPYKWRIIHRAASLHHNWLFFHNYLILCGHTKNLYTLYSEWEGWEDWWVSQCHHFSSPVQMVKCWGGCGWAATFPRISKVV